jgi:hypothetical protein
VLGGGEGVRKLRPTASRLRPDYLADFLHEQIWHTFYIVVLPDFLAYYFLRFHVQKDILSYLNITNWPSPRDFWNILSLHFPVRPPHPPSLRKIRQSKYTTLNLSPRIEMAAKKITNVPLLLKVCDVVFVSLAKQIIGQFLDFFFIPF